MLAHILECKGSQRCHPIGILHHKNSVKSLKHQVSSCSSGCWKAWWGKSLLNRRPDLKKAHHNKGKGSALPPEESALSICHSQGESRKRASVPIMEDSQPSPFPPPPQPQVSEKSGREEKTCKVGGAFAHLSSQFRIVSQRENFILNQLYYLSLFLWNCTFHTRGIIWRYFNSSCKGLTQRFKFSLALGGGGWKTLDFFKCFIVIEVTWLQDC